MSCGETPRDVVQAVIGEHEEHQAAHAPHIMQHSIYVLHGVRALQKRSRSNLLNASANIHTCHEGIAKAIETTKVVGEQHTYVDQQKHDDLTCSHTQQKLQQVLHVRRS